MCGGCRSATLCLTCCRRVHSQSSNMNLLLHGIGRVFRTILESSSGSGLASILPDDSRLTWLIHDAAARSIASPGPLTPAAHDFRGCQSSTFASQLHKLLSEIQLCFVMIRSIKVAYFLFEPLAAAHVAQTHLQDHVTGGGFCLLFHCMNTRTKIRCGNHSHSTAGRTDWCRLSANGLEKYHSGISQVIAACFVQAVPSRPVDVVIADALL